MKTSADKSAGKSRSRRLDACGLCAPVKGAATGLAVLSLLLGARVFADENEWFRPLGLPPKAAPRNISGGESFPPLPLPATPLRRSERKRDPSPPKLIAKIVWGETASFKYDSGIATEVADWNLCPADLQQLMRKATHALGTKYSSESVNLAQIDGDPAKTPMLFFSGARTIKFDDTQLAFLRSYVVSGGMIICDNIAGSPYFYTSFRKAMEQAFPESVVRTVALDHPLHHMLFDTEKVRYPKNVEGDTPHFEAIYVGCRIGVLLSRYGMGTGWDDHEVPMIQKAAYYDVDSANKLGMNMVAYSLGYANVGREEAKAELFGALDEKRPTDEFVFAQIKHGGVWNVHPGGASALLRRLRQNTSIRTSLKRVPVSPGKEDISSFPFLYLTGLDDFSFDADAVAALKKFLNGAGTLVINNGLGMKTFDTAVRRELKKILPDAELQPIPPNHPLHSTVFKIEEAQYTPVVVKNQPALKAPALEGISIGGDVRIIYSKYDLEAGWQGCEHPLAKGYEPHSAMQLGINIVMYAMTH